MYYCVLGIMDLIIFKKKNTELDPRSFLKLRPIF